MPVLTNAVDAALRSEGYRVRQILPGTTTRQVGPNRFEADLSSPDSLRALHATLATSESRSPTIVGGIASFLAMTSVTTAAGSHAQPDALLLGLFHVLKEFGGDLQQIAREGGGAFLNFTAMDGVFGLHDATRASAFQSATAGLIKSFAQEAGRGCVRNIDLDASAPAEVQFSHAAQELGQMTGEVESGMRGGKRVRLEIRESPVSQHRSSGIDLDSDSVVLVTGGARGVTALIAQELARETGARIVLIGRTPLPGEEAAEFAQLLDPAALRQHFIAASRNSGQRSSPAEIERSVRAILRDREIRANVKAVQDASHESIYQAIDVRNDDEFSALIEDTYRRWGRIDAVIHGAGLIEDKLIRDKSSESFTRVFETKVRGANTLVRCLRPESLKYFVFFTSVSGRFGNAGQCDYSAANEYLSKLARNLDAQWPARVVAMSWGPWDAGMMSDELRRLYRSRGINPMPPDEGVTAFLNELRLRECCEPEIVLGSSIPQIAKLAEESKRS